MTEKCSSCEQMKKENSVARKAMMDTNKQMVDMANENLASHREIGRLNIIVSDLNRLVDLYKSRMNNV